MPIYLAIYIAPLNHYKDIEEPHTYHMTRKFFAIVLLTIPYVLYGQMGNATGFAYKVVLCE